MPSHYEGLGLSAIEALCARRPLIATNIPGLREVVTHEYNALVVPAKSPNAISQAVLRLLEDNELALQLSQAGPSSIVNFDMDQHVDDIEAEYGKLQGQLL
jgi:glycosyltransferase involved in cell wall biosynthesis